jgi:hypothetical protein
MNAGTAHSNVAHGNGAQTNVAMPARATNDHQ